jgi:hypothetical protein
LPSPTGGTKTVTVTKGNQTITFNPLSNKTFGDPNFGVSATATSGLAVTFTSQTPSVCTIVAGPNIHIVAAGTCTIRASQAGNSDWNPAPNVDQSFTVNLANQTITFGPLANKTVADPDFPISATGGGSGNAVTFSSLTTGVCTVVAGPNVHLVGAGTCTIRASQAGNANYNPAPNNDQSFTVIGAPQTITVTMSAPASAAYGSTFNVSATASSGLPVAITTGGSCSGSGSGSAAITMTSGTGTCSVHYDQTGNFAYNAAPQVNESTTASKANAIINVTPYSVTYDGAPHTATATATGVELPTPADLSGLLVLTGTTHTD